MSTADLNSPVSATILPELARGLVDLSSASRGAAISLPYPSSMQRALDRIVLACLREGVVPPSGVPGLVRWCTAPLAGRWQSAADSALLGTETSLLDPQSCLPTRSCVELASYGQEGLVEQDATRRLHELAQAAHASTPFEVCRDFLIQNVFVTNEDLRHRHWKPAVWKLVKHLYQSLSSVRTDNGCIACPGCGLPALSEQGRVVWCEGEICASGPAPGRKYVPDRTLVLDHSLRLFLALPGRTERSLMQALADCGVTATVVPGHLGIHRLDKPVLGRRAIQVFDRLEPTLLAARLAECPGLLAVVPDRLTQARTSFVESVRRALPGGLDIDVTDESGVAKGVLHHA